MKKIILIIALTTFVLMFTSFIKYPEMYLTTWKYKLQQEIENGDNEAINYYMKRYVANGKTLFE